MCNGNVLRDLRKMVETEIRDFGCIYPRRAQYAFRDPFYGMFGLITGKVIIAFSGHAGRRSQNITTQFLA